MTAPEWLDGFDVYNSPGDMMNGSYNGTVDELSTAVHRTGTRSVKIREGNRFGRPITHRTKYYTGAAIFFEGAISFYGFGINLYDNLGRRHGLFINENGTIVAVWNEAGVWTSPQQLVFTGAFYYFEVSVDIAAGELELRFNGSPTPLVIVSGLNTAGKTDIRSIDWGCFNVTGRNAYVDDVYLQPDKFLGAQRCYTQFVDSDEVTQDWTGILSPNYTNLDSVPYNNADYIESATVGDVSDFGFDPAVAVSAVTIVNGARLSTVQNLDISGTGETTVSMVLDSGTTVLSGNPQTLSTSPIFYSAMIDLAGRSLTDINDGFVRIERTG